MNPQFLLLVAAIAVHWKITATILIPEEDENTGETTRIVNGFRARRGQFPFAVALYMNGNFSCTGSIISENYVLTAAHCVVSNGRTIDPEEFKLVANRNRRAEEQRVGVREVMPHEDYGKSSIANDIAVLRTSQSFEWTDEVGPIPLATANPDQKDECRVATNYGNVYAMGWGRITPTPMPVNLKKGEEPVILKYGQQQVICNEECEKEWPGITDRILCATGTQNPAGKPSGVCLGDSGGPLVEELEEGEYRQIGIASAILENTECGSPKPEAFSRVTAFGDWIALMTGGTAMFVSN